MTAASPHWEFHQMPDAAMALEAGYQGRYFELLGLNNPRLNTELEVRAEAAGQSNGWSRVHLLTPWMALALIYVLTALFTEVITNNAAAVLMFPIALAISEQLGVNFLPFAVAVMFAASASFITPLGYQTNLMVYGPGRYRFTDYMRMGVPLSLTVGATAITLIPMVWSF